MAVGTSLVSIYHKQRRYRQYCEEHLMREINERKNYGLGNSHLSEFSMDNRITNEASQSAQIDAIPLRHKCVGLICILIAIICWVSLGHILQILQSNYDKPYIISYCVTIGLFASIIPWIGIHLYEKYTKRPQLMIYCEATENVSKNETTFPLWKRLILLSFIFCILIVCCGYFWILSLDKTMVSVNTAIYQSNAAIIYILSICLLNNRLTIQKNIGVIFCGIGIIIVLFGVYKDED
eukprot:85924_1